MFEVIETTNGKFESVLVIDKLADAIQEMYRLRGENPDKDYTIYNEQGLEL
jgi:hypothetical protein